MAVADRPSKWKFPLIFLGSLLGVALLFQLVEMMLPADTSAATRGVAAGDSEEGPGEEQDGPWEPMRPILTREDDQTILIELGFLRRSRYRFGDDDEGKQKVDALYACLEKEFDQTFAAPEWNSPDASAAERSALRRRMKTIVRESASRCLEASTELPVPPVLPQHPSDS